MYCQIAKIRPRWIIVSFAWTFTCFPIIYFNDFCGLCQIFLRESYFDKKNRKKNLTFLQNYGIFIRTSTIHGSDTKAILICPRTQSLSNFRRVLYEKIAFGSVFTRVCGILGVNFRQKKVPAQFVFGFGVYGATARLGSKIGSVYPYLPV